MCFSHFLFHLKKSCYVCPNKFHNCLAKNYVAWRCCFSKFKVILDEHHKMVQSAVMIMILVQNGHYMRCMLSGLVECQLSIVWLKEFFFLENGTSIRIKVNPHLDLPQ